MTKMIHDYTAANSIDASADYFIIDPASSGIYKKINRNTALGLASAPLGTTDTQSPTNKTFDNTNVITVKDGSLTIQNSSSTTKQAVFSAASITAGQTRTFTFPDASGTIATIAGTQTLTNKTITSPTITGGTIDNSTITVDSISGHTVATTVTVANLQIANGVLNTANAVTSTSIADGAVQPKALVTGTGSGWAWQSYTPTLANLTLGNGTLTGKYCQIGKTVVGRISFVLGSTSAVGTSPTFTLPVTAIGGYAGNEPLGTVFFYDSGIALYTGQLTLFSTTVVAITASAASGSYVTNAGITSTVPFTWGTSDSILIEFMYEAA